MSMDGLGAEEQQRKDGLCKVRHEQEKSECGWTADRREWEKKNVPTITWVKGRKMMMTFLGTNILIGRNITTFLTYLPSAKVTW